MASRHNIDLVGLDLLNELDYAWMGSYNQRALLVRAFYHSRLENKIERVKFFTREKEKDLPKVLHSDYNCDSFLQCLAVDDFYESINGYLKSFEQTEIIEEYWKEVVHCIEVLDLKCEKHEKDKVEFWSSEKSMKTDQDVKKAFEKMSKEQREYVSAFVTAMATDMRNGQAKMWIGELVNTLLKCIQSDTSKPNVKGFFPCRYDTTNTVVETIFGDLEEYDAPYKNTSSGSLSNSSSLSSLASLNLESEDCKITKKSIVPDYYFALPDFPGVLPFVVELKPAYQESRAYAQITQQMLSKLFFQDVVFGIVVSPRSYQLFAVIKKEGNLHFAGTPCVPIIKIRNKGMVDVKQLNTMCTFIYRVIKWAVKTKCLLTEASSKGEGEHQLPTEEQSG